MTNGVLQCCPCPGYAQTSQQIRLSSGDGLLSREGTLLGVGLPGLEAVVQAAEEAIEKLALSGDRSVTGDAAPIVVCSSTG